MKIRIKGNSLRYRLTRPEVAQFVEKGSVTEQINFGNIFLQYSLRSTAGKQLSASFIDNCITVYFPASLINEWIDTGRAGFEHYVELKGTEEALHLLVEKDYTCLENVDEDQSDHYPNPLLKTVYE